MSMKLIRCWSKDLWGCDKLGHMRAKTPGWGWCRVTLHGLKMDLMFGAPLSCDCAAAVHCSLNRGMWPAPWISENWFLWQKSSTYILEGSRALFRILLEKQAGEQSVSSHLLQYFQQNLFGCRESKYFAHNTPGSDVQTQPSCWVMLSGLYT